MGNARIRVQSAWVQPVHPHACGERPSARIVTGLSCGSSPRMWGTHGINLGKHLIARFIPTHVGNARPKRCCEYREPVHPHACGERTASPNVPHHTTGSSPRMWGTQDHHQYVRAQDRFIPTHVGNAVINHAATPNTSVHPHACGERFYRLANAFKCGGSSPRMWGTHVRRI